MIAETSFRYFDWVIMVFISINSLSLALYDYSDRDDLTTRNKVLNKFSEAFAIIFLVEAGIKIIALGFVLSPNSYLRSSWNVMDFLIVLIGYFLLLYYL